MSAENGDTYQPIPAEGMSLRDHFAAAALTGLMGNGELMKSAHREASGNENMMREMFVKEAWILADAMLKARG